MKNILYLAYVRLPTEKAHGAQIMKTCEAFATAGAQVELIIPGRKTSINEDAFNYYGIEKKFSITNLNTPDFIAWGPLGFALSAFWFSEVAKLKRSFWDADIIYSRDALVLLQYILLGKKFVYEAHTKPTFVSKIVAKRADHLVVISEGLREVYKRAGVRGEIIVAHDAVDIDAFQKKFTKDEARKQLGIPEAKHIAMYVGLVDAKKGADTLVKANELISDDTSVVIIGGGPLRASLEKDYPNVIFLPETPYKELPNVLAAADVLVIPNSSKDVNASIYTSPLKLFGYMASGVPIIASDVPALREIADEESAIFFIPDDPMALAREIELLLKDPEKARALAESALAKVADYTWEKRARKILAIL